MELTLSKKIEIKNETDNKISVYLSGDFGYDINTNVLQSILLTYPDKEINFILSSGGGSLNEAFIMGSLIFEEAKKRKMTVTMVGLCASACTVLYMHFKNRVVFSTTMAMIHNVSISTSGNSEELKKTADMLDVLDKQLIELYYNGCGGRISKEKIKSLMQEERYLTANELIDYGFANEINKLDTTILNKSNININYQNTMETNEKTKDVTKEDAASLKNSLLLAQSELNIKNDQINTLDAENKSYKNLNDNLSAQINDYKLKIENLDKKIEKLENENKKIAILNGLIEEQKTQINALDISNKSKDIENQRLRDNTERLNQALTGKTQNTLDNVYHNIELAKAKADPLAERCNNFNERHNY